MISKKMIQNIALSLTIATSGSIALPNLVSAKSLDNTNQVNIKISAETTNAKNLQASPISQDLINKATPFVKTTQNGFYLSKEGYSSLNSSEIKIVLNYINASNINLKNAFKENNLTKRENSFVSLKSMAASSRGYIGLQHMWWGDQIYLSHQAVTDLNDFLMGAGTASGIAAFLAKNGIKLAAGYVSSIALFATPVAWAMSKVDNGNGVYLNCILYVPCTITPA